MSRADSILLRGGIVIDGGGDPGIQGDVLVEGGFIRTVGGRIASMPGTSVVDVGGLVVCPGFIDMHAHSDIQIIVGERHQAKIMQGITTEVVGQDGLSYAPVRDASMMGHLRDRLAGWNGLPAEEFSWRSVAQYLDALHGRIASNVASLVPHGTVRMFVLDYADRPPDPVELRAMRHLVASGLDDGAIGLSLGLTYVPGSFAAKAELVGLSAEVAKRGGYLCPHHRSYGAGALEAYAECIDIARESGVRLHFAHAVMNYSVNRGKANELLALMSDARANGVQVTMDGYPYTAGATYLAAVLPSWANAGDDDAIRALLRDDEARRRVRHELEVTGSNGAHGVPVDWTALVVAGGHHPKVRQWSGSSIAEIAAARGESAFELFCHVIELDGTQAGCINFAGHEENIRKIMQSPYYMIGTDAILVGDRPHPRGWGAIPRFLGRYVRDENLLSIEEGIRKLTSLPASVIGARDRGLLRPGHAADLVCLDAERVIDRATYDDPMRYPDGIEHVMVNGDWVVRGGRPTGAKPGHVLARKPAGRATGVATVAARRSR